MISVALVVTVVVVAITALVTRQCARRRCSALRRSSADVLMANPQLVREKLCAFRAGGSKRLQVVADFDRTLSIAWLPQCDSSESPPSMALSCHGVVEGMSRLSADYKQKAKVLFDRYHPIELDTEINDAEKMVHMREWYRLNHELMLGRSLCACDIAEAVRDEPRVQLRERCSELVARLAASDVPLLVLSAGIGNVLTEVLRQRLDGGASFARDEDTRQFVVSNLMKFEGPERGDGAGPTLSGFSEPLVHMLNKSYDSAAEGLGERFLEVARGRTNILLLGDGLGDATMADGAEEVAISPDGQEECCVLRVAFLNYNSEREDTRRRFLEAFDVVIVSEPGTNADLEYALSVLDAAGV